MDIHRPKSFLGWAAAFFGWAAGAFIAMGVPIVAVRTGWHWLIVPWVAMWVIALVLGFFDTFTARAPRGSERGTADEDEELV